MPLGLEGVADFVASTIHAYDRGKWTDISMPLVKYVSQRMIRDHMVYEEGGDQLNWDVQVSNTGSYRVTGVYDPDVTNTDDNLVQASVPWRMVTGNYSYDMRLPAFQSDRTKIISFIAEKEHGMKNDYISGMERDTWSAPTGSTDKRVMGIPFWIQKSTTTPNGALNGANPSGFSDGAAGINSDTYTQWRNWAGQYASVTTSDLVSKLKRAIVFTEFEAPDPHPTLGFGNAQQEFYTVYNVIDALERLAETRNDKLGSDVARFMGAVTVGGVPIRHVPYLTANDSDEPVYGINWQYLRPFSKKGSWMRRTGPLRAPFQHTVYNVFTDCEWNWRCVNRRTQFVISK